MGNGRKINFRVIAFLAIAFFFSETVQAKIDDQKTNEISSMLKIADAPFFSDYTPKQLKTIFNKLVKPEQDSQTTYGILIMASFDEMEFMDAILSQRFLDKNRAYFDNILRKRIDLSTHWKKTGQNMVKMWQKGSSATPVTALALESVEIVNKTMAIFDAWEVLDNTQKYKGLWRYFDTRENGEPHEWAWELSVSEMRWAASPELEQQFAALYEKWGPYATPHGISEKYKKQLAGELRDTLAMALEEDNFAKEEPGPSLAQKLAAQLENIKNILASLVSRANPFRAGPLVELSVSEPAEEVTETGSLEPSLESEPEQTPEETTKETPKETFEASVTQEPVTQESAYAENVVSEPAEIIEATSTGSVAEKTEIIEVEPRQNEVQPPSADVSPQLCEKKPGDTARRYRVLIDEVAWMGSKDSANNEWVKLKNIFSMPVNLSGWQMQDKDRQIKKIFSENEEIQTNGYLLLERSKDYTGALNNTDEALYIFDNQCTLEDEVLANPNWPAGDNATKEPMKRFDAANWYSGSSPPPASVFYGPSSSAPETSDTTQPPQPETPSFTVLINEIAWAGTKANSADEWIELYNTTGSSINLTGWTLKALDGTPSITFSTSSIPAGDYFLLERTDNTTVNDIAADLIYTGALGNAGEGLELRDASNNLIDSVDNSSGWAAGQASPDYISMERVNSTTWASNNQVPWDGWIGMDADNNRINGTPKTKNSASKTSTAVTPGGFAINNNLTLTYLGSPYLVEGSINVLAGAKLTIQPGVTVKFKHSGYWHSELKVEGELEALGGADPSQKITFTSSSTSPAAGDWEWLYLKGNKANLENVIIEYAGKKHGNPPGDPYFTRGAIFAESGDLTVKNSTVRNSQTLGIWLKNYTNGLVDGVEFSNIQGDWEKPAALYIENATTTVQNSTFRNNQTGIIIENISGTAGPAVKNNSFQDNQTAIRTASLLPDFSGNMAQDNNQNGIVTTYFGFTGGVDQITLKPDLDYIIEGQPTIPFGKILNIQAGAIIKFKGGGRIQTEGNLRANGLPGQKIIFTSYGTIWDYIGFSASSTDSILDNVVVSNGGYYNNMSSWVGAVQIYGLNLTIKNSSFENNKIGIGLVNAGFSGQTNSVTMQNNWVGIFVEGACPNLNGITISDSQNYDVFPTACQNP